MSVHKRNNGTWYVHWRDENDIQHTKNFGKESDSQSKALEFDSHLKNENLIKRGYETKFSNVMYLDIIAQKWINAKKAKGCRVKWIKDWTNILQKYLLAELCEKPIVMFTEIDIIDLFVKKFPKVKEITMNRYLSYLKIMLTWAVNNELIERNPLARWIKPKDVRRRLHLTVDDLRKIIDCAAPHLKWALEVAYNLGVRTGPSELLSLKWHDIDFENKFILVFGRKTKDWREIPLSNEFLERLLMMKEHAKTEYIVEYNGKRVDSLKKSFRTACELANITYRVNTYDIRHLFATTILRNGGDLAAVSKLLGHASTKMTADVYYHALASEKRRAIKTLPSLS